ncbi:hypothetical protein BaRGS_00021592 [Batillaria attramentaria]|uniref:Uncharacterized protein n=1 Tax=Batillaria attramentaria TaxID=370345 RepID=A0ABD0KJ46_9CAEN
MPDPSRLAFLADFPRHKMVVGDKPSSPVPSGPGEQQLALHRSGRGNPWLTYTVLMEFELAVWACVWVCVWSPVYDPRRYDLNSQPGCHGTTRVMQTVPNTLPSFHLPPATQHRRVPPFYHNPLPLHPYPPPSPGLHPYLANGR